MTQPIKFIATASKPHAVIAAEMCEEIKAVVYSYADKVPAALAIGVLEIAKQEILEEQR